MPEERDRRSISTESSSSSSISPPTASINLACLPIGCSVSAKYRGAFCSAKVKSIDKHVKVKVTLIDSGETLTISDEDILHSTSLQIGQTVSIRLNLSSNCDYSTVMKNSTTKKQAVIKKIIDNSIYTVVFNDGDETTLRRASLCLQGIRLYQNHIGQSKSVPHLRPTSPINEKSTVVCIRRKNKNSSQVFPALVLKRQALPDYLWVKSFLDGNEYVVHRHDDIQPYRNNAEMQQLCRSTSKQAAQACERFLRYHQIPSIWQKKSNSIESDDQDVDSDDETTEEKDSFLAQLLAFMDDRGTPINTIPQLYNYDLDLHRLFKIVRQFGGSNKVTKNNQWAQIHMKMGLPSVSPNEGAKTIEQVYKKFLHPYENLTKKLGNLNSRTSDVRRSLFHRRSQATDDNTKLNVSTRKSRHHVEIPRSLSTESDEKMKNRKRIHSKSTDSPSDLRPALKVAKISLETMDFTHSISLPNLSSCLSPMNDEQVQSTSRPMISSSSSSSSTNETEGEMPSIFQTLLLSSSSSSSSTTLTYDEISLNELFILRDNETLVRCLDKDDEKSLIYVSYPSNSTKEEQWIEVDRIHKRADQTVQSNEKDSSNSTYKPAPIRPYKRRLTRDFPISNRIKSNNGETSPSFEQKRIRIVAKRNNGRRLIGGAENKTSERFLPLNFQLRQRLEDMFENRTSRYNFLDLNQTMTGENRLEHLKDRLRQCQKVFFNLQTALKKIDAQRELFLRNEHQSHSTSSPLTTTTTAQ